MPNLAYTDGNAFNLWQNGELQGSVVRLEGDVETAGAALAAPPALLALFSDWQRQAARADQPGFSMAFAAP